jgi:hypothetical protein
MAYPDFSALKRVYSNHVNALLSSAGLTTECNFNFVATNTNIGICPNCIYDISLKKSSGKYKSGGPTPFVLGKICPYCNGAGNYSFDKTSIGYLAIIWDYKKWINPPPRINITKGSIQTICHRDYLPDIRQCKDLTVIYKINGSNPVFRLYGEPKPVSLGDNEYIITTWERVGANNAIPLTPSVSVTSTVTPTATSSLTPTPTPTPTSGVPLSWNQLGSDIDGETSGDNSGYSVSLNDDGNILAIGAILNNGSGVYSGHTRVYSLISNNWIQLGQDINGEAAGDYSGHSVSLNSSGDILAIGARFNDGNSNNSGHTRVYYWNGSSWIQRGNDINGEAANDSSGFSVSLNDNGTVVAIGEILNDGNGNNSGRTRIFYWDGSSWIQRGNNINGNSSDQSGYSVSLNGAGDIVAIGAIFADQYTNTNDGSARAYVWNGSSWIQRGDAVYAENSEDRGGHSISLNNDGTVLAIGGVYNDGNGVNAGYTTVYYWSGSSWIQRGNDIDGEAANDNSGFSVSLNGAGNILAIGARYNDGNGNDSGHTRVYYWTGANWIQLEDDIDGEAPADESGYSVSLNQNGTVLAIGAIYNDGNNGVDSGSVRVYQLSGVIPPMVTPTPTVTPSSF